MESLANPYPKVPDANPGWGLYLKVPPFRWQVIPVQSHVSTPELRVVALKPGFLPRNAGANPLDWKGTGQVRGFGSCTAERVGSEHSPHPGDFRTSKCRG